MKSEEILKLLEEKGIIVSVGGDYLMTEKYKELLEQKSAPIVEPAGLVKRSVNYDTLLNPNVSGDEWPDGIAETSGRTRAGLLMNAIGIPVAAKKGYRLKGLDKTAVNIIGNIVGDPTIHPPTFIAAIKLYYEHTEMPKGFKALLIDGDVLDLYQEYISGELQKNLIPPSMGNQRCL